MAARSDGTILTHGHVCNVSYHSDWLAFGSFGRIRTAHKDAVPPHTRTPQAAIWHVSQAPQNGPGSSQLHAIGMSNLTVSGG